MLVVLAGLLLVLCLGCGGDEDGPESFGVYHLETAIGPPGDDGELRCGPPRPVCPGVVRQPPQRAFRYAVRSMPAVTDEGIDRSTARQGIDSETGEPIVIVGLTAEGRRDFARVTREAARLGGRDQAWHHVAVVVGNDIVAFPQIDYDDHPDGITNARRIQFTAGSVADADDLVLRLRG